MGKETRNWSDVLVNLDSISFVVQTVIKLHGFVPLESGGALRTLILLKRELHFQPVLSPSLLIAILSSGALAYRLDFGILSCDDRGEMKHAFGQRAIALGVRMCKRFRAINAFGEDSPGDFLRNGDSGGELRWARTCECPGSIVPGK